MNAFEEFIRNELNIDMLPDTLISMDDEKLIGAYCKEQDELFDNLVDESSFSSKTNAKDTLRIIRKIDRIDMIYEEIFKRRLDNDEYFLQEQFKTDREIKFKTGLLRKEDNVHYNRFLALKRFINRSRFKSLQ